MWIVSILASDEANNKRFVYLVFNVTLEEKRFSRFRECNQCSLAAFAFFLSSKPKHF